MAVELDGAHQEFSNAIVVAQATSKQMSKRDPLRPYMNIIDDMLVQMLSEDPTFKPQGGKLGETDMDYDTDNKTMAALRRQLQKARDEYYRYKRMVARYAPPISYNFLNLIHLDNGAKTIFEKRMGNIDDAVPFFGKGFNKIYPLIMVIYTILIATNFFVRVINYFVHAKAVLSLFSPERSWLQQGHKVSHRLQASKFIVEEGESSESEPLNSSSHKHSTIKMQLGMRPLPTRHETHFNTTKRDSYSTDAETDVIMLGKPSSAIASTWESMKIGFRNLKSSVNTNKFIPLSQVDDSLYSSPLSSSESLDEIFMRINRQGA
ncbi:UNVERIFIED_CONTAM: hypothetical protein Scaly_1390800 [Sesamum calycinum]|uniref:LMBR1-like membrane protein n=1 Tax=Sesamum calycinum TaxID=2727403 RepID=A0AAW2PRI2_9LAMI